MLALHDTDTDTDSPNTATILRPTHARPREEIACVGRKIVAVFGGVGVGVGVRVGVVECQHIGGGRAACSEVRALR